MSKQTINIGASPNDGTGTPLRTSFDYTNQNFTELYTALGGGVGLPGATTQVIFNDGGTNLAGDAGLVYNKTTDALTVAGLVTAGSATITGDLTVDTSTLKVDSTNNRVGIGTASPAYLLDIADASFATRFVATNTNNSAFGAGVYIRTLNGASMVSNATLATSNDGTFNLLTGTSADSTKLSIGPTGVFTFQNVGGVAGTAMTLNSTGLGIGTTTIPYQLTVASSGSSNTMGLVNNTSHVSRLMFTENVTPSNAYTAIEGDGRATGYFAIRTNDIERVRVDASGNLLVGKTASSTSVAGAQVQPDGTHSAVKSDANPGFFYNTTTAISGTIALFRSNGVTVGTITQDGTNTAYVTSSDYRLKEAVQPMSGGLARVSALKPSIYKWKSNGSTGEGFLAHELAEVVPAAVVGTKDALNEDGTINPQGIDLSKIVPILVAAIQELTAEVNALKNA